VAATTTTIAVTTTTPPATTTTLAPTTTNPPATTTTTSTTTTTIAGCASGVAYADACWFLGAAGETCDTACANQGLVCDEAATRDVAGSGGTLAACDDLVDLLFLSAHSPASDVDLGFCGSPDLGLGCYLAEELFGGISVYRATNPMTTCAADGDGGGCGGSFPRVCACVPGTSTTLNLTSDAPPASTTTSTLGR
jgi:hypothetical protein